MKSIRFLFPCFVLSLTLPLFAQQPNDPRAQLIEAGKQERSILLDIELLDKEIAKLQKEESAIRSKFTNQEKKKEKSLENLHKAERILRGKKSDLRRSMQSLYMLHRRGLARIIFGSENPEELRRRSVYLSHLIAQSTSILEDVKSVVESRETATREILKQTKELEELQSQLRLKKANIEIQKEEKKKVLSDVQNKREVALQLISELTRSRSNLSDGLQQKTTTRRPQNTANFRSLYGKLPWPVRGRVVRSFGKQKDPYSGEFINHLGIDIEASIGTPVTAVAEGTVQLARFIKAYGQTIAISHDNGTYSTVYAHLSLIRVKPNDVVKAGQTIGLVGNSGLTSLDQRSVLTFEVRYNRAAQDPLPWLRKN